MAQRFLGVLFNRARANNVMANSDGRRQLGKFNLGLSLSSPVPVSCREKSDCIGSITAVAEQKGAKIATCLLRSKQDRIGRFTVTGAVKVRLARRPCRASSSRTYRTPKC